MRQLVVIGYCLLLSSCTLERTVPPPTAGPLDSTIRAQTGLSTGKIKFTGPVTFQIGGTNNTASSTAVAKAKAPVAAAPHATATDASRTGGTPWQVFALVAVVSLAAGIWLSSKLCVASWISKLL